MKALLRVAILLAVSAVACARSESSEIESDPLLVSPGATNPGPLSVCVSTDCPAPWATCPSNPGLCTTDTSRDLENCGACANACPKLARSLHATSVCSSGSCQFACDPLSADCNHLAADGCEVYTGDDPNNCGACGLACKTGEICWKGACGCPSGFTNCDGECTDLQTNQLSCGTCHKECEAPPSNDPAWTCGPLVQPTNTGWSCGAGACEISCERGFGNCDEKLCSNGCETDLLADPLNCGGCGITCAANQDCVDGTCICPAGTTRCGKKCVDVNVDPNNCGECGNGCPGAGGSDSENGTPTCKNGTCGYMCYAGFADCDGRIGNGCEVNIGNDPKHCGGCDAHCDSGQAQPCVLGACLTKPCGPAPGTQ